LLKGFFISFSIITCVFTHLQLPSGSVMHSVWYSMRGGEVNVCNAGVDIQKDVLDLMGFKPLMPQVKDMDRRCFSK